jgi:putative hydrolase of the HAD superfamily
MPPSPENIQNASPLGGQRTKYGHLLFDLDHTLWDFEANAKATLQELHVALQLEKKGVDDFERFHKNYIAHNEKLWERYRNGYIKQEELRIKRMWLALLDFKISDEELAQELSARFMDLLPTRTILFPYTKEILQYLKNKGYSLHLVTNGFEKTQQNKLMYSGLRPFFTEIITSEGSGSLKPSKEIFQFALDKCCATASECIMIGDNVEVDIIGAMNAGIDQVYVNHLGVHPTVTPTYSVHSLKELEEIF